MKQARIPNWLAIAVAVVLVGGLVVVGMKVTAGDGPRDPSTYPKSAYKPPAYTPPAGTYTKDGVPVGAPSNR